MRVLLTGASGQLGAYVIDALVAAGHDVRAWSGREAGCRGGVTLRPVDLTDAGMTLHALAEDDPAVVLHGAAMSAAEAVRLDPEGSRAVNVSATERLARWCSERDRRLIFTSTDLVFDGSRAWWRESDRAEPILAYGRTKRAAESSVLAVPLGLVARISLLYGRSRCDRIGFFDRAIGALRAGTPQAFFEDEYRTPLDWATAAGVLVRLVESPAVGVLHVAGRERVSRFDLMCRAADTLGLDRGLVRANRQRDVSLPEPRPADVSLDTTRLTEVFPDFVRPTIEEALSEARVTSP